MRLPVILVQTPPAGAADVAERLVGELIGRPGLDLTLVDRFESIRKESTDQLTLESITTSVAVLDWQSPEEMLESLERLGMSGLRWPHRSDPVQLNGQNRGRRFFFFDLRKVDDALEILAELNQIRESLAVKTVSIGGLSGPTLPVAVKESSVPTQTSSDGEAKPMEEPPPATSVKEASDDDLDSLIDRLDQLDV